MALNQEEIIRHQQKQADLKNFIQVLTPLVASPNTPEDIRTKASRMMHDYLDQLSIGIPDTIIRKV